MKELEHYFKKYEGEIYSLLKNKFIKIALVALSVLAIYEFGKRIGEVVYYITN